MNTNQENFVYNPQPQPDETTKNIEMQQSEQPTPLQNTTTSFNYIPPQQNNINNLNVNNQ